MWIPALLLLALPTSGTTNPVCRRTDGMCPAHPNQLQILMETMIDAKLQADGWVCDTTVDPALLAAYNAKKKLTDVQFVQLIAPMALASQEKTGVPASVTIAQAILESGWGRTDYSMHNNLFGMRGSGDAGKVHVPTWEFANGSWHRVKEDFAAYSSPAASVAAHDQLIATSPLFASAMKDKNDPYAFANDLQKDGYATDPKYAAKLKALLKEFDLARYDASHCGGAKPGNPPTTIPLPPVAGGKPTGPVAPRDQNPGIDPVPGSVPSRSPSTEIPGTRIPVPGSAAN